MTSVSCLIVLSFVVLKASGSVEQFDEVAWMDNSARDKYFEYSELSEPSVENSVNNSDKVDALQFEKTTPKVRKSDQSSRDR